MIPAGNDFRDWLYWSTHGGKDLVAVLGGFFDRSEQWPEEGKRVAGVVAVAGLVLTWKSASALERKWARITKPYGGLHMKELIARTGAYEGMTLKDEDKLLWKLIPLVEQYAECVSIVLCESDFAKKAVGKHAGSRTAYSMCCLDTVVRLYGWLDSARRKDAIFYILDRGDPGQSDAVEFFDNLGSTSDLIEGFHFSDAKFRSNGDEPLLGTADLLAWEAAQMYVHLLRPHIKKQKPTKPPRPSFFRLHQNLTALGKLRISRIGEEAYPMIRLLSQTIATNAATKRRSAPPPARQRGRW